VSLDDDGDGDGLDAAGALSRHWVRLGRAAEAGAR
jgi:hypothetical protein